MESRQVSGKQSIHYRNYRRARDKYPDTYKQLLDEQRSFDEQEGKTWVIDSNSKLTVGIHTRANTPPPFGDPADAGADEGYDGGEA